MLVVPSIETPSWIEQFGRVALEAMASGVTVVASNSGALPEVLGGAGVLVPPDDVAALAEALTRLRDDPAERARLGRGRSVPGAVLLVAGGGRASARSLRGDGQVSLDVVVVTYNSAELVPAALEPLPREAAVIVVDNASTDDSVAVARRSGAECIENPVNAGFGAAANIGVARGSGDLVLLLNPDARIDAATLESPRAGGCETIRTWR